MTDTHAGLTDDELAAAHAAGGCVRVTHRGHWLVWCGCESCRQNIETVRQECRAFPIASLMPWGWPWPDYRSYSEERFSHA